MDVTIGSEEANFDFFLNLTADELRKHVDEYKAKNWRPHIIQMEFASAPVQYLAIFRENHQAVAWDFSLSLTQPELEKAFTDMASRNLRPRCIGSQEVNGQPQFTVLWEAVPDAKK